MAKTTTTLLLLLLLLAVDVLGRPGPAFHDVTPIENHHAEGQAAEDRDNCVGLREDECMMKRTVEAQLDYIYTQKKKHP
ncbi:phytosulfokines-like isoform X2 [Salvia miltiorrhiza]|uniref:phytosulfokines-like isoform X2 n=1 Tax=Salvia miltiorrhiza TaxID=226208 RepID=UPI0025AD7472|nr:phytosulfokines-like isoform X2 [Salvia miltiorrhiza]